MTALDKYWYQIMRKGINRLVTKWFTTSLRVFFVQNRQRKKEVFSKNSAHSGAMNKIFWQFCPKKSLAHMPAPHFATSLMTELLRSSHSGGGEVKREISRQQVGRGIYCGFETRDWIIFKVQAVLRLCIFHRKERFIVEANKMSETINYAGAYISKDPMMGVTISV